MARQSMTYIVEFDLKPGREEAFRKALDPVLDEMRGEESFLYAALSRDAENPNRFVLFESWSDHDDVINVQLRRPYRDAMNSALEDVLAAPRALSVLQPLRTDSRNTAE